MAGFGRIRVLPAALVALMLVSATRAAGSIDFGFYPAAAQDCLYAAADSSKCESGTVPATNACLCRNGGDFITTAAACLGRSSRANLRTVYRTLRDACDNSDTPVTVTEDDFMAAAEASTTTTSSRRTTTTQSSSTSATSTTATTATDTTTTSSSTSTATSSPDNQGGSGGLSTGVLAGIIVGVVGALALLGAGAFLLFRRRRKLGEESHPMLPQQAPTSIGPSGHESAAYSIGPSGRESTAYYGSPPVTGAWPKKDWASSTDPRVSNRTSGFNWESPSHLSYPVATLAPSPPLPAQELDGVQQHFPTGSTEAPAEMGGTPVVTTPPPPAPQYQPYHPPQQHQGPAWGQPPS